jgi:hypothetical protein
LAKHNRQRAWTATLSSNIRSHDDQHINGTWELIFVFSKFLLPSNVKYIPTLGDKKISHRQNDVKLSSLDSCEKKSYGEINLYGAKVAYYPNLRDQFVHQCEFFIELLRVCYLYGEKSRSSSSAES